MFESVVFPAPFSPRSACTSPAATSKSMWSFATTAGNRFVIPRSATAVDVGGEAWPSPPTELSALGATDDALDEPIHRVEVLEGQPLALFDAQLATLVVQRTGEFVERALDQGGPLPGDRCLRLRADLFAIGRQTHEALLETAVVEVGLPGPVNRGFRLPQVVRAPVVDRRCEPLLRRERVCV